MANAEESTLATVDAQPSTVDAWWDDAGYDEVEGYDLVKEEALFSLVGVPFRIYGLVFRDGIQSKGVPYQNDYVSVELRVAPPNVIRLQRQRILSRRSSKRIQDKHAIALAGEQVVFNDGSTGVYRQMMSYLISKNQIVLPDGPLTGPKNECVLDYPRSMWVSGAMTDDDDNITDTRFDVDMRCMRGLRFSDYENDYTSEGLTWYVA